MFRRWLANGSLGQVPVIIMGVLGAAVARCELATIERFDVRILRNERRDIVAAESDNGRAIFEAYWPVETVVVAVPIVVERKEAGRRKDQRVHTRTDRCAIRIGCAGTRPVSEEVVDIFLGKFHTLALVSISGTTCHQALITGYFLAWKRPVRRWKNFSQVARCCNLAPEKCPIDCRC